MDDRILDALRRAVAEILAADDLGGPDLTASPVLTEWVVVIDDGAPYLVGRVFGHPGLGDGRLIATSALVAMASDGTWARTLNTLYALGRPSAAGMPH